MQIRTYMLYNIIQYNIIQEPGHGHAGWGVSRQVQTHQFLQLIYYFKGTVLRDYSTTLN